MKKPLAQLSFVLVFTFCIVLKPYYEKETTLAGNNNEASCVNQAAPKLFLNSALNIEKFNKKPATQQRQRPKYITVD